MTADIGNFLGKVFNKDNTLPKVIDLKELNKATKIESRKNAKSQEMLTALNALDKLDLNNAGIKDGYLSGDELTAFFNFANSNRTTQGNKILGDVLTNSEKRDKALTDNFDLTDDEQIKAENYRLLNAILDPSTGEAKRDLSNADIKKAEGADELLGTDDKDGSENIASLKTNAAIVITEDVAKERVKTKKAEETAAAKTNDAIIEDGTAELISKGSGTEDPELTTWLKTEANAKSLKEKVGLTNGVAKKIVEESDDAAKKNLQLALNSLRLLVDAPIVKGSESETAGKQPANLDALLTLEESKFTSPFYKIRRDAALTILLALTKKAGYKEGDYKTFEGDQAINKATHLLSADSQQFNSYTDGSSGGPGKDWLNNNIDSTKVTAEQISNLAKINTVENLADRGKAWAAFYKTTQGNIQNFAAEYLLDLDKVKGLTGDKPKDKAASLITMIEKDTVSFEGQNMLVKNGAKVKYTIPIKTSGIIWDTSGDGSGAKAALEAIFIKPTSSS